MRLNWHAPRGSRMAHRPRPVRPLPVTPTRVQQPSREPACTRSAASLACVRLQFAADRLREAIARFDDCADRITDRLQEIHCQTAPYHVRIEHGYGQIRVYMNGILQHVFDVGTAGSQYGNGAW